jgi:hypothetical protein
LKENYKNLCRTSQDKRISGNLGLEWLNKPLKKSLLLQQFLMFIYVAIMEKIIFAHEFLFPFLGDVAERCVGAGNYWTFLAGNLKFSVGET